MNKATNHPSGVVVVVDSQEKWLPLLSGAYRLAEARDEALLLFAVEENDSPASWIDIPSYYNTDRIETRLVRPPDVIDTISKWLRENPATLVVLGAEDKGRGLVCEELDPLIQRIKCPVAIVKRDSEFKPEPSGFRMLVPFQGDENSNFAIRTALDLDPNATITAAMTVPTPMEDSERESQDRELSEALSEWAGNDRVVPRLLTGPNSAQLLVAEADHHDVIVMGVGKGLWFLRAVMGDRAALVLNDAQRSLIQKTRKSTIVLRSSQGWFGALLSGLFTQGDRFMPTLSANERIDVYRTIRRSARPTQDFFIMIASSACIASVGLIVNSPAVIIGAMLIAPLMSAIIGMGLSIVQGDLRFLGLSAKASLRGVMLAIVVGFLIGVLDLGTEPSSEMLARTEPSLLDLLIATVSGFAAAYALCRKDLSAALPGVAIAVALVPPLATVGLFAGMGMPKEAYGAFLLFATNLAAITLASGLVFTLLGFHPPLVREGDAKRYITFQRGFLITGLVALAVFSQLVVMSVSEVVETRFESIVRDHLTQHVIQTDKSGRLVDWSVTEDYNGNFQVKAAMSLSEGESPGDLEALANVMQEELGRPIHLEITWLPSATIESSQWPK